MILRGKGSLLGAVLCGGAALALAWWGRQAGPEGLHPRPAVQVLGRVRQGEKYPVIFHLSNRFKEAVRIVEVVRSCTCTAAQVRQAALAPGEETEVEVIWESNGSRGPVTAELWVGYERGEPAVREYVPLRLEAEVLPDIRYEPEQLVFVRGREETQVIRFFPGEEAAVRVLSASCDHKAFTVKLRSDPATLGLLEVHFQPAFWLEETGGVWLVVQTNSQRAPTCRIPLLVRPQPEGK
jgi:hypothetical protein